MDLFYETYLKGTLKEEALKTVIKWVKEIELQDEIRPKVAIYVISIQVSITLNALWSITRRIKEERHNFKSRRNIFKNQIRFTLSLLSIWIYVHSVHKTVCMHNTTSV
jgi:hypothetical protein